MKLCYIVNRHKQLEKGPTKFQMFSHSLNSTFCLVVDQIPAEVSSYLESVAILEAICDEFTL